MELIKLDWSNQRVMTTAQVAKGYGCAPENISNNFNREKNRFKEGEHYFKLEGGALREFKKYAVEIGLEISPYASVVYLWTEQGVLHHCKMINTETAWKVFGELERVYFEVQKAFEATGKILSGSGEAVINSQIGSARKPPSEMACAYIFDTDKNQIKIGHTGDISDRIKRVQRKFKVQVTREHHSAFMTRDKARDLEMSLHKKFLPRRTEGEFYSVPFEEATQALDKVALVREEINLFEIESVDEAITDFERGKELVKLIATLNDSPLKEQLVRLCANLLLGKKLF